MGIDCRISLPANVRVRDVAKVIGRLAGLEAVRQNFGSGDGWVAQVKGVEATTTSMPELAMIVFGDRHTTFHFECETAGRLLLPRSTPFWCALACRLVDFFGGEVDYSDSDATDCDYAVPHKSDTENRPEDGEAWYVLQQRIVDLLPLSRDEIKAAGKHAAYPKDDYGYRFDKHGFLMRVAA
jgi:hypothetical protein